MDVNNMNSPGILLYDPDCGFCTQTALWMRDSMGLECLIAPMSSFDLATLGIDEERAQREIPYVTRDFEVFYGAQAFSRALSTGSVGWQMIGKLLDLPAVSTVAQAGYRVIAANRYLLPGATESCRLQ